MVFRQFWTKGNKLVLMRNLQNTCQEDFERISLRLWSCLKHAAWGPRGRGRGRAVGGPLKPRLGLACPPQSASHSSRWGSICVKSHGNDAVSGRGAHLEGRRLNLLYICPLGIRRRKDCERLSLWPGHERQRTVGIFLSGSIVMNCFSEGLKLSNRRHGTGMSAPVRTLSIQERSNSTQEVSGRWQAERDTRVTEINYLLKELGPLGKAGARG